MWQYEEIPSTLVLSKILEFTKNIQHRVHGLILFNISFFCQYLQMNFHSYSYEGLNSLLHIIGMNLNLTANLMLRDKS